MSLWLGTLGGQSTAAPPAGFVQGSSGFYYKLEILAQTAANWFANTGTWPAGGTPAVPQDATQSADIWTRVQAAGTPGCYLGWKRANDSSPWLGPALGTPMPYTNWDTGYPRSGLGENYLILYGPNGKWRSNTGTAGRVMMFQWPAP